MTRPAIGMIGAGRVATGLALALKRRGCRIAGFSARHRGSAARAAARIGLGGRPAGDLATLAGRAGILIICVPDAEIPRVADALYALPVPALRGKLVLHTSGAAGTPPIAILRKRGARVGCLHPLASFPPPGSPPALLDGTTFGVAGDPAAQRAARRLARTLGGSAVSIAETDRPAYHLAATMVASGTAALLDLGIELTSRRPGLSRRRARAAFTALLASVARNIASSGTGKGLTGPVSRGDVGTVARHLEALRSEGPFARRMYRLLSLRAIEMSVASGRLDAATAGELRRILGDD